MDKKGTADD